MREKHKYDASDYDYLEERFYQNDFSADMDSRSDADVDPNAAICIGMDFNANINWIVAGQPDRENRRLNVIKSFYVKIRTQDHGTRRRFLRLLHLPPQ